MGADLLNVEAFHGLLEVIQNADDLNATEVRVAIIESGKKRRLLIAHNGERVFALLRSSNGLTCESPLLSKQQTTAILADPALRGNETSDQSSSQSS